MRNKSSNVEQPKFERRPRRFFGGSSSMVSVNVLVMRVVFFFRFGFSQGNKSLTAYLGDAQRARSSAIVALTLPFSPTRKNVPEKIAPRMNPSRSIYSGLIFIGQEF